MQQPCHYHNVLLLQEISKTYRFAHTLLIPIFVTRLTIYGSYVPQSADYKSIFTPGILLKSTSSICSGARNCLA